MKRLDHDDPIFDDMVMLDMAERRKFLEICAVSFSRRKIRERSGFMIFSDWKVYVSLLLQMGFVDLHDQNICSELLLNETSRGRRNYSTDDTCRICHLYLQPWGPPCDLPAVIRRLDHLAGLIVGESVKSLPFRELALLPRLISLAKGSDLRIDNHGAPPMKLPNLRNLFLCSSSSTDVSPMIPMLQRCVSLDYLGFQFDNRNQIGYFLDKLPFSDFCWAENLQTIKLEGQRCPMEGRQLETLLFRTLHALPNIREVWLLDATKLSCFKAVADRIRRDTSCSIPSSLRRVRIQYDARHPIRNRALSRDPDMKAAVIAFLRTFVTVDDMQFPRGTTVHSEWEYELVTNMAGRRLLDGNNGSCTDLPLSIWPTVIQRAQRKIKSMRRSSPQKAKGAHATGIYYLLREGPALLGRGALTSASDRCLPTPKVQPHSSQCCVD